MESRARTGRDPSVGDDRGGAIENAVGFAAAGLALVLAGIALAGWVAVEPGLVRIRSGWPPMPPDAALALLLIALGAIEARRGRAVAASGLGIGAALLAVPVLVATSGLLDLGAAFDRPSLFAPPWPSDAPFHATPVPPNTAIGLLTAGLAVVAAGVDRRGIAGAFGAAAWVVGTVSLVGYVAGLENAYTWRSHTPMAPSTAVGLVLVSSGILLGRRGAERDGAAAWYVPLTAGLASAAIAVLIHQALLVRQEEQIDATVDATAQRIRTEIHAAMRAERESLNGLAHEWENAFFKRRGAWESDVRIAIAKSSSISSIAWFETDGQLNWRYPSDRDPPEVVLPPAKSRPEVAVSWTRAIRLQDGARGFALVAPLRDGNRVEGWLCGAFRSSEFFGELSKVLPEGFAFQIDTRRAMIFDGGLSGDVPARWVRRLALERSSDLTVTLHPSQAWLGQQHSQLPAVVLGAGLALSALLVLALRSAQTSAARSVALEGEVRAHERAEAEIRRLNLELEDRVAHRTAELRRTNEELKSFASFLSHELRQPVSAQALWAELLEAEYAGSLDEQGREYVEQIRRYNRRTSDLIGAQLMLAEIGSAPVHVGPIDVDSIIEELRRDLKPDLDAARAAIRKSELPDVQADPRHVYQLFRNLIENSIKYRRGETPLEVRVFGRRTDSFAEIRYSDNGRGFAAADADRIFDVFERAGEASSEGVGIGLAVCRRIMDRCGGTIEASADPEGGALFLIRFPLPVEECESPDGPDPIAS